ncbi:MAG: response regulator [Candidatus Tectomicrobia bacterium]|uniref:Response regulator n=1 Tax=Tectimicrobiota bacterium TaxID=2528274 RepID=A0A932CS21_UNCTE|nr:response regulator [Candidatus Tectomicrobia bacterium]
MGVSMGVRGRERSKEEKAKGWRILVVDDEEGVRKTLVDILYLFGYEADAVASGEEALAVFDEARHALLIADHCMPGMRGAELIRILHRRCPSLPIIAMTGIGTEGELLAAGAHECFIKPLDIGRFKEAVERDMQGKMANPNRGGEETGRGAFPGSSGTRG